MKIECFSKGKKIYLSADEFSVSQLEKIIQINKQYSNILLPYNAEMEVHDKCFAEYMIKEKEIKKQLKIFSDKYCQIAATLKNYEVKFSLFARNTLVYCVWSHLYFEGLERYGSKKIFRRDAKPIISELEKLESECRKLEGIKYELYKKLVPPAPQKPDFISLKIKVGNRLVTIYSDSHSLGQSIKALEYKNKKQAIDAKAAAYDGTQRVLAHKIKNDIYKQIHMLEVCPYCGKTLTMDEAHADHIYPVVKGGLSTTRNMVYVCAQCNLKKRDMTLRSFIKKYDLNVDYVHSNLELLGKDF